MGYTPQTPFDSIESTHEYVELLVESIEEAQREVDADILLAVKNRVERREQALRLVAHNLSKLHLHTVRSRRILNDLRTLRRLLLQERENAEAGSASAAG
ncbi:MAG: hypothetical protein KIT09_14030 [Bryobacteraceae bacterium]|nr:hypothetical protein [Bryobacteraceae bacterium]